MAGNTTNIFIVDHDKPECFGALDHAFYCRRCEQFHEDPACPACGNPGVRFKRNTANNVLWGENVARMQEWCRKGRMLPEVG